MIYATLGTHPQPMDRLVSELDRLLEEQVISEPILVQAARFARRPRAAVAMGVIGYEEHAALVREARVVLTHGGPGSIMAVLAVGKVPVVVPRDPEYGEHVDDHQLRFCRWLAVRRPIRVIENVADIEAALLEPQPERAQLRQLGPSADVLDRLRALIEPRPS